MAYLPLANIVHHKLRSALSALGIACAVCMLVTLSGLARGSLDEVADRWEAVNAELIVYPLGWGQNVTSLSGIGLSDWYAGKILEDHGDIVERVTPVFLWPLKLGGQDQLAAGVDPEDFAVLVGGRRLVAGRLFDPDGKFARWLEGRLLREQARGGDDGEDPAPPVFDTQVQFADPGHCGLELVIDTRLAEKTNLRVNDVVRLANHDWTIVGIVAAGGMSRVFLPRRAAQFLFGSGSITKSTLMFVKLKGGVDASAAARRIRRIGQEVVQVRQYRAMLARKFGIMFRYVDAVNVIALVIAFLFIMNTLYTVVLQRAREIAILMSCGASGWFIVRQVVAESLILTGAGAAVGIGGAFITGSAIGAFTLYTVTITWRWLVVAAAAALAGAVISALYPAWRATRIDVLEALTLE